MATIGIDLGTTNSVVASVVGGTPVVIKSKEGYNLTPSVFAITSKGRKLAGHLAKRQAILNPERTIWGIKRLMGKRFDSPECKLLREKYPYKIVPDENGFAAVQIGDRIYSPQEISAFILVELKRVAEEYFGEEVKKAIVTVPAHFNDNQRQATKEAAQLAGLELLKIINEPTASALAYGFRWAKEKKIVAVYDLGGGTFDISILQIGEGIYEVLATSGDTFLGGDDFDARIVDLLAEHLRKETGVDIYSDPMGLQRLKDAAEKAKIELSTREETVVNLPFISSTGKEPVHLIRSIKRAELEAITYDLVEKTIGICYKTIQDAGINIDDITDVLLVGGMTRMPLIRRKVEQFFVKPPVRGVHPDEAVAIGAAIEADALEKRSGEVLLIDVTPISLGIAVKGGVFHKIIERNTKIPVKKVEKFTTSRDNQDKVIIMVFQGESSRAEQNELLGEFVLSGIRPAPAGVPEIEVEFEVDHNGVVNVSARDVVTGVAQSISVHQHVSLDEKRRKFAEEELKEFEISLKERW
jgi:molecular chaperone DnaK